MDEIQKIYSPLGETHESNEAQPEIFPVDLVRFSLGRQALFQVIKFFGKDLGKKPIVAVPRFICRDVPEAISAAGADIIWYDIKRENFRCPAGNDQWSKADIILVVNYFGMAASLEKYDQGKIIIEDNAHGLFGKSAEGNWLGTRADVGIFSLRKSLPVNLGAGLYLSTDLKSRFPEPYTEVNDEPVNKLTLRSLAEKMPASLFLKMLQIKRKLLPPVEAIESSDYEPGKIYFPENVLQHLDRKSEVQRRRDLLKICLKLMKSFERDVEILSFESHEVPYAFAFILLNESRLKEMKAQLSKKGLDLVQWPALPDIDLQPDEEWYHNVYFIPFLW